jgi:hypothetical protein
VSTESEASWEPRPGETTRQYDAFLYYDRLGPSRSVDKAYQLYLQENPSAGGDKGKGEREEQIGGVPVAKRKKRAPSHWQVWSSDNEWVKRAQAHDAHNAFQLTREMEQEHRNRLEKHRQGCAKMGAEQMELARLLAGIATAEARVHVGKLQAYEKALREGGKKTRRPKLPPGLSSLARASAHVALAAQVTEAQALGVDDLMIMLDRKD